jgi:phenylacetate-CoA ligase
MIPRMLYYLAQANRTYYLSREDLQERKRRSLARSMRWAYEQVPFYHSCFKGLGKTPEDFARFEQLARFPTLSRTQLTAMGREAIRASGATTTVTWATTGTSGVPLQIDWTEQMNDVRVALALRRMTKLGVRPWSRLVSIWPPKVQWRYAYDRKGRRRPSTTYLDLPLASVFERPFPTARILVSTPGDLSGEARTLRASSPDFVFCRPSHLRQLALQLDREGIRMTPSGVFLTGEPATAATLNQFAKTFSCPVCTMYACSEAGNLGGDCRAQRGIHLYEDFIVFEVIRDDERVGPGETGELVITSLYNDAMPLIRYRTGDLVKLADDGRCDCGSSLLRLESIQGRVSDGLMTVAGSRLPAMMVANEMERRTGFSDFQLSQKSMSVIEIGLAHGERADSRVELELTRWLSELIGAEQTLSFVARDDEELWTKSRPVVSTFP